jgi:hypothetical protein
MGRGGLRKRLIVCAFVGVRGVGQETKPFCVDATRLGADDTVAEEGAMTFLSVRSSRCRFVGLRDAADSVSVAYEMGTTIGNGGDAAGSAVLSSKPLSANTPWRHNERLK